MRLLWRCSDLIPDLTSIQFFLKCLGVAVLSIEYVFRHFHADKSGVAGTATVQKCAHFRSIKKRHAYDPHPIGDRIMPFCDLSMGDQMTKFETAHCPIKSHFFVSLVIHRAHSLDVHDTFIIDYGEEEVKPQWINKFFQWCATRIFIFTCKLHMCFRYKCWYWYWYWYWYYYSHLYWYVSNWAA